jgi:chromosome segregation protein
LLKLKRVEIQGFKSFADRTEMRFAGAGVAAIVGPNGCGKSNLSDAISWVLGEQSAKSLRGARMEDVIFAGTRDRKPLGMAAVTMTLVDPTLHSDLPPATNGHGSHPAAEPPKEKKSNEITITRRLFRSGESEYLIDGKSARLRDIQDIFMGSGLGPESYAIIEQGRIGQILSSRPQDRRGVIEEAAGITRFKTKRRLAEAKLEGAKQNLSRVFDILEEVGRQVNSLKRQASKAKRYEELRGEMTTHLRAALSGRFRLLEREASKTAIALNLATTESHEFAVLIAAKEQEHVKLQEHCYSVEAMLTERRKNLAELRIEAERTRGRLANQAQQIGSIEQRLTRGETETQDLEARLAQLERDIEQHSVQLGELERQTESARQRLTAKNEERDMLQGRLRGREQGMESARQQVLRLLGEASTLKNQLAHVDEFLASMERDRGRAEREAQIATGDLEKLTEMKAGLSERSAARQLELESLVTQKRRVEETLTSRKQQHQETRRQLEGQRAEASRLKARKDSLEEILSHRAYTTESVKRLFTAIEHGQASNLKPAGVLADFVEVDPAYEKATEEFLHEELEYVVVADWEQAEQGIDLMRSDLDGRATFLVHPEPHDAFGSRAAQEPPLGPETGIISRLSDVLRMTNGLTQAPAELLPRLSRCFLAHDRAAAQRLASQYPDIYFLLPDGVCYHGHAVSGGKKTGSGPLALKRELRELNTTTQNKQRQVEATTELVESLEQEIAALSVELDRLRIAQQSQEKEALAIDHEMRKLSEELNRSNQRLSVARLELDRLSREKDRAQDQRERNQQILEEKEQGRRTQEQALEAARAELGELQAAVASAIEEHSVLRVEMASFDERRRSEAQAKGRIEHQIRELSNRRQQISNDLERLGVEKQRLLSDNIGLDARAAQLTGQIEAADTEVITTAEMEQKLRGELAAIEELLKARRIEMQEAQEKRSQIELGLVKLQAELKYLDETGRKELNLSPAEIAAEDQTELDEAGLAEAENKYQEVKARIDALGPVNPLALEEFQVASEKYEFLNTQRQDLLDSIRDTEKAISEIDVESRKRFAEAYEKININFREMFKLLFGGGVGEMRLTDESNLNESGIEIVASPPGKRLQNVLLLSGGEKSLTAMALLMAIFRYQPSPFCILDEVDAPLDEANIGRLANLLREMSLETQFIVITHAKRTMESAQTMYGVTMQEPGVSKLVSVRFNQAPPPPPPSQRAIAMAAQ